VLSREATNTKFIVFGLTQTGLEPTRRNNNNGTQNSTYKTKDCATMTSLKIAIKFGLEWSIVFHIYSRNKLGW
jgi:hypothetical protein